MISLREIKDFEINSSKIIDIFVLANFCKANKADSNSKESSREFDFADI